MMEPWLRATMGDVHAVPRAVVHALEQAREDVARWTADLSDAELWAAPHGLAPVGFQLRHIAGTVDRLTSYAAGAALNEAQLAELGRETAPAGDVAELRALVAERLAAAEAWVRAVDPARLEETRVVGRRGLETTLAGLLIHTAEHTQRHVGQLIVTVRVVRDLRLVG